MNTTHNRGSLEVELPVVTPREIAAYVREGRRLRDEEISKLSAPPAAASPACSE
jgi:hypothetical protein